MLPHPFGQVVPALDLRHQPPKIILPSSSPSRPAASGSCSLRKRSARVKNCCSLRFLCGDSVLYQFQQHAILAQLSTLGHMLPTFFASLGCKVTLSRTAFSATFIAPSCTIMVDKDQKPTQVIPGAGVFERACQCLPGLTELGPPDHFG